MLRLGRAAAVAARKQLAAGGKDIRQVLAPLSYDQGG
jgi:hypothetical protein